MSQTEPTPIRAAGLLLMVPGIPPEFLLMEHPHRLDFPKGHLEPGEGDLEGALREMEEETGIHRDQVRVDPAFRHEVRYMVPSHRFGPGPRDKILVMFLGWLDARPEVVSTEHHGHRWVPWNPPHRIQAQTIDEVLAAAERHMGGQLSLEAP